MWGGQTEAQGPFKKVQGEQRTGLHSRSHKVKEGLLPRPGGGGGGENRNGEQNKIENWEEGREGGGDDDDDDIFTHPEILFSKNLI